jgi:hypothetical protein
MFDFIDWTQTKIKLTPEQRAQLFDDELGDPADGVTVLSDAIVDHRRWTVVHEIIFKIEGAPEGHALRGFYEVPATESQEVDGDWYKPTFTVMVEREVTRKEWQPKVDA